MQSVDLSKFIQDPNNANKGTARGKSALEQSISELGAGRSVVADKNGVLIAGNKTVQAAIESGLKNALVIETTGDELVVVKRVDLDLSTDDKAKLLAIADNRIGELSLDWDPSVLSDLSQELDLSSLFTNDELEALLTPDSPEFSPEEDEEIANELVGHAESGSIESRVTLGQVWQLGRHFIACADSTDEANIRALMKIAGVEAIDMVWTDPPYGVAVCGGSKDPRSKTYKSGKTIENDTITGESLRDFLKQAFDAANIFLKPGGVYYIAHPDIFAYEFIGAVRDTGWLQARPAVVLWIKDRFVFGQGDYHSRSEPILYGWKPGAAHKPVADRTQDNVWEFGRPQNVKDIHPSVKPIELVQRAIENSSDVDEVVYDPFLGSGTTLIASHQSQRSGIGFELSPDYCEVICQRFEKMTGIEAELVGEV